MRIYGVSNPHDNDLYCSIDQIALNPEYLEYFVQGYIIWYKDWNENEPLTINFNYFEEFSEEDWNIWECHTRLWHCKYENNEIIQNINYEGVIELGYEEGKFKELKYWKSEQDYLNRNITTEKYGNKRMA